jgi:hypothetical protein
MRLREVTQADRPRLLQLNAESVQMLSELDEQRLEFILSLAAHGTARTVALFSKELQSSPHS